MNYTPRGIDELAKIVIESKKIVPCGGGTKVLLSKTPDEFDVLDMTAISGIVTYDPGEYTFTALSGTPVADVISQLNQYTQYLPFDPVLVHKGATLGGTIASGINGPGRYRYGGMRDFLLAARFMDGRGEVIKSGEKVVKNSAGFDFHKLLIGSQGRLGILVELTFKVFPRPESSATIYQAYANPEAAYNALWQFSTSQLDLDALDLEITNHKTIIWVRIAASTSTISRRIDLTYNLLGGGEVLQGNDDEMVWDGVREFSWVPSGWYLTKIPIVPSQIPVFEKSLVEFPHCQPSLRRYSSGGQQLWLAMRDSPIILHEMLLALGWSGLAFLGPESLPTIGKQRGQPFLQRIKNAVDPFNRFAEI